MEIAPAVPASSQGGGEGATLASSFQQTDSVASFLSSSPSLSTVNNGAAASRFDEDDEEGDVCRICRNPGDAENSLRYPCACSGSIKFVHQDCLFQWLNHSNARQCEVIYPFFLLPLHA